MFGRRPPDLIIDEAVVRFHSEMEGLREEMPSGYCWYEEAMQYYLRRLIIKYAESDSGRHQVMGWP